MPRILSDHPIAHVLVFHHRYSDASTVGIFNGLVNYRVLGLKYANLPGTRNSYAHVLNRLEAYEVAIKLCGVSDFTVEV